MSTANNGRRLEGRNLLVTGAAGGGGRAAARRFAAEGGRVLLLDRNADGLNETVALILADGGVCHPFQVELTDPAAVEGTLRAAAAVWGGLHGVFNAAGGSGRRFGDGPVADCTVEGWDKTLALNLDSLFYVCKYALPPLLETRGAVVNLASVLGLVGGTIGYGIRSFYGYLNTKNKYQLSLTESLYYQNLDNNAGVFFRLLDEAEEQENCESMLV